MRLGTRQTGIISYAGLDESALWAEAKRAFAQCDEDAPARFRTFLPIFPIELVQNMRYVGEPESNCAKVSALGFCTDPAEYHRQLYQELPDLYVGDNYRRNFDVEDRFRGGGVMTVDKAWITHFPQYQPFLGERLVVYMIGGGCQAVAVPESVFPRGGGVLAAFERDTRIAARCVHYAAYVKARLAAGEAYDAPRFEAEYLSQNELSTVCIRQRDLGRVMQDLCIINGLAPDDAQEADGLYTLNAKRAEEVRQYVPWRYACDTFEAEPVSRATARLMQLGFAGDGFVSDLWLPYQEACAYIDRRRMTLDVRALCEGFQLAPAYDPRTRGGRYPTVVRVAVVRDRDLRPMVADVLNNPAYGSGMGPLGMLNKLVFLPESHELLRQNRLMLEAVELRCENASVDEETYRRMRLMARWQEWKGRLIDALYRRESALSQMQPDTPAYQRACELLTRRVEDAERGVERAALTLPTGQLSGYDADIDYLRRMQRQREGVPEDDPEPVPFAPDPLRELCIESGYAMRRSVRGFALAELETELPEDELEADEGSDEDTSEFEDDVSPFEDTDEGDDDEGIDKNGAGDDDDADDGEAPLTDSPDDNEADNDDVDEGDVDEDDADEADAGVDDTDVDEAPLSDGTDENATDESNDETPVSDDVDADAIADADALADAEANADEAAESSHPFTTQKHAPTSRFEQVDMFGAAPAAAPTAAPRPAESDGEDAPAAPAAPYVPRSLKALADGAGAGARAARMAQLIGKEPKEPSS